MPTRDVFSSVRNLNTKPMKRESIFFSRLFEGGTFFLKNDSINCGRLWPQGY